MDLESRDPLVLGLMDLQIFERIAKAHAIPDPY